MLEPEEKKDAQTTEKPPPKHRHTSWWWGVIPAVAAAGIIAFWLTGQFEEIFGIDPRGTWHAESEAVEEILAPVYGEPVVMERKIKWEMLINDVSGDLWMKLSCNREEIIGGPLSVAGDSLSHSSQRGSFNGVYYTDAGSFRYNPFAKRYIKATIRLGPGDAYSLMFERD